MTEKLKIRPAKRTETAIIIKFIKALAEYEKMSEAVTLDEDDIQANIFDNNYANVVFLEVNKKIIGFAVYYYSFSTFHGQPGMYLEDFYIEPKMRGNGYGKETLAYLAKIAIIKGCSRFEWSCLKWNSPAIKIYEKMNATKLDEWVQFRLSGQELNKLANEYHQEIEHIE